MGLRVLSDAKSMDEEREILNAWVVERAGDPLYCS